MITMRSTQIYKIISTNTTYHHCALIFAITDSGCRRAEQNIN